MTKMMHFFTKLAAATLCLGYLAACAGPNPLEARLDPATQYPIKADSQLVTQPVLFPSGQITLSKEDKASLNAFVKHFYKSGGHMLEIRQTATTGDPQAEARLLALRRHLLRQGVQNHISGLRGHVLCLCLLRPSP